MLKHFDHLTIVVQDIDRAKAFFEILVSRKRYRSSSPESHSPAKGAIFDAYYVTLVLETASPTAKASRRSLSSNANAGER